MKIVEKGKKGKEKMNELQEKSFRAFIRVSDKRR